MLPNFDSPIVLISAGMKNVKKDYIHNEVENTYLNYGLLGLATILHDKRYKNVIMFQGDRKSIEDVIMEIEERKIDIESLQHPILISVPSFFAIDWANDFINKIKQINQNAKIVVGGRWVIDLNMEWIQKRMPKVDFFCGGCPDEEVDSILVPNNWNYDKKFQFYNKPFTRMNYTLLHNYQQYRPCVEVSRGCNFNCAFCYDSFYSLAQTRGLKPAKDVFGEIKEICDVYGRTDLNFYLQASTFVPDVNWSNEFLMCYKETGSQFGLRFETRVDVINLESIEILSKAGLKVVDLGLESASERQLLNMGKTHNPSKYLSQAEKLLRTSKNVGVWAKLNILLYRGETKETIAETIAWLDKNKENIKGISVNPFILYLDNKGYKQNFVEITSCATTCLEKLKEQGYVNIDLSEDISADEAKEISKFISDRYMTLEDYLELKKVCYTKI